MLLLKALLAAALLVSGMTAATAQLSLEGGFAIQLKNPRNWRVMTAEDMQYNLKRFEGSAFYQQQASATFRPVAAVALMKHSEPFADINPCFVLSVIDGSSLPSRDPFDILNSLLGISKAHYPSQKFVEGPKAASVAGLPAAYARINVDVAAEGKTYKTTSLIWVATIGSRVIMTGGSARQDQKTGKWSEIRELVNGVSLSKQTAQ